MSDLTSRNQSLTQWFRGPAIHGRQNLRINQRLLRLRAALNRLIRDFFEARGVLEVETPILSRAGNTEPAIESFVAQPAERRDAPLAWLRTSPEYPLKRLLAAGIGDCYELGRVFRAGERGRRHNPEFTMLEWYRVGWDHLQLADEVVELVTSALALVGRDASVKWVSYRDLFRGALGLDPFTASDAELDSALSGFDVRGELDRDDRLNLLLTHRIEPGLPMQQLTVVHGFPPSQAALSRIAPGPDGLSEAQRFEVYLGAIELANGYHELADAAEQRARFERDQSHRAQAGRVLPPIDEALLSALSAGLPDCAGVALGVDRLLMAMLGTDRIDEVLAVPYELA
jgi:lysyl-tRNA synthetase class 2